MKELNRHVLVAMNSNSIPSAMTLRINSINAYDSAVASNYDKVFVAVANYTEAALAARVFPIHNSCQRTSDNLIFVANEYLEKYLDMTPHCKIQDYYDELKKINKEGKKR